TPAAQTPAAQTPAAQTPAAQTPAAQTPAGRKAAQPAASPLRPGTGLYPRAIRLHNGVIAASVVTFDGNNGQGAIYQSHDDGSTFAQVGTVADPAAAQGKGLCCATLYELPHRVGALPAGTLLWAASIGQDTPDRRMRIRVWSSPDQGRNWSFLATIATADSTLGLWEPEFTVAANGQLVVFFSDETDQPAHSQKLVEATSADGVHWTSRRDVVALADPAARPGMPVVRQLHPGDYLMSYEICGSTYGCAAYQRRSADGAHWGDPAAAGTAIVATDGTHFAHAPNITVGWHGEIILVGQVLQNADGSVAAGNGATIMLRSPGGRWTTQPAPVSVPDARDNYCPNYSSALLPTLSGLLEIATDYNADGVCQANYASINRTK
ncbi:MAG TPA: exo-alpha-sialidase, partial [Mycobacteriales bacterium]|nr:exo-alpha-sialidase [Mycobacteriales bacterium]